MSVEPHKPPSCEFPPLAELWYRLSECKENSEKGYLTTLRHTVYHQLAKMLTGVLEHSKTNTDDM